MAAVASAAPVPAFGQSSQYLDLSPEDLLNVEVTSVTRRPQPLGDSAAAVFVISQDDIRRSSATTLPELLRMVPGLHVARINASDWAITARGFNGKYAAKLLVLLDGRSLYTPLFSGVFWGQQDTMLEDIDRIEVIRGPGATLWGANAVNGVINIITKSALNTTGLVASSGSGSVDRGFLSVRQGFDLGQSGAMRLFAKATTHDGFSSPLSSGLDAGDQWNTLRAGVRFDSRATARDRWTLQGDLYRVHALDARSADLGSSRDERLTRSGGGNVLARWTRAVGEASTVTIQGYFDRSADSSLQYSQRRNTVDLDAQHTWQVSKAHQLVWGGGYRLSADRSPAGTLALMVPEQARVRIGNLFAQDSWQVDRRWQLTLGSKFERNSYTGWEIQPSARLTWQPNGLQTVWGAVSSAARTPSRAETGATSLAAVVPADAQFPGSPALAWYLVGDPSFDAEHLTAYELGYRVQPTKAWSFDATVFHHEYRDLRTARAFAPSLELRDGLPVLVGQLRARNDIYGHARGLEVLADWGPLPNVRSQLGYTALAVRLWDPGVPTAGNLAEDAGSAPAHQVTWRWLVTLPGRVEVTPFLRAVSRLEALGVPGYSTLDLTVGWRLADRLEFSLVGQNLLSGEHQEFTSTFVDSQWSRLRRGAYAKLTARF